MTAAKSKSYILGIIQRQSFKNAIVTYLGVLIGGISNIFIYPLDFHIVGRAQFIINFATFLLPFAALGTNALTVRFFPDFKNDKNQHHGFLTILLLTATISFLIFSGILLVLNADFVKFLKFIQMDEMKFVDNKITILAICLLLIISNILASYISNFRRIVIPILFSNILLKIGLPVLVIFFVANLISTVVFKFLLTVLFLIACLGLVWYAKHLKQFSLRLDLSFLKKGLIKKMLVYAGFGILNSLGYLMAFRIDNIMITTYIGYDSNGIYNFFLFMSNVIIIPFAAINAISGPIISESWKKKDLTAVKKLYRQSSETSFIAGLLILIGIWLCMDDLLHLTPRFSILYIVKWSFLFLAIGQLINMTTGLNDPIIAYSKYYKFNVFAVLLLAVLNVYLNYKLIPTYRILGAALATAISISAFNLVKFLFIWIVFRMQPLSIVHIKTLLIATLAFAAVYFIPLYFHPILNIFIKGTLFLGLYAVPIIGFRISEETNQFYLKIKNQILRKILE